MTNVIEVLEHEHRVIQKIVQIMSHLGRQIEDGQDFEQSLVDQIVQFMRIFGEQCHHGKEEKALFSLLETRGVPPNGCPIAALIGEHRHAHALLDQLEIASAKYKSDDKAARGALLEPLKALEELYRQHIWKEEYLLFPMANKVLSASDYKALSNQFAAIESQIGFDVHHAMEAMVNSIGPMQEESLVEAGSIAAPECSVCGS